MLIRAFILELSIKTTSWTLLIIIVAFLLIIYRLYETLSSYLIPALQGKPILTLDDEKLFYTVKNKTIYWDDLRLIRTQPYGIFPLKLTLNNGKKVRLHEDAVKGNENEIYKDILLYFNQNRAKTLEDINV
jgi:hypothetical protein